MRFREPHIRAAPQSYTPLAWRIERVDSLPTPDELVAGVNRRSCRAFTTPPLGSLSTLLWHTARCQEVMPSPSGFDLQLRPVPSAGAIHPIHLLVEHPETMKWARYDPVGHSLQHLSDAGQLASVRATAAEYVHPGEGVLLIFAAEPGLTEAKYADAESLVWRDAGVLQGAIAMVAPHAGLACCLLGLTADRFVESLGEKGQLVGVGVAILGAPR